MHVVRYEGHIWLAVSILRHLESNLVRWEAVPGTSLPAAAGRRTPALCDEVVGEFQGAGTGNACSSCLLTWRRHIAGGINVRSNETETVFAVRLPRRN